MAQLTLCWLWFSLAELDSFHAQDSLVHDLPHHLFISSADYSYFVQDSATRPQSCTRDLKMVTLVSTAAFSACLSTMAASSPSRSAVPYGHRDLAYPSRPPVSAGVVYRSKSPTQDHNEILLCILCVNSLNT